MEGQTEAQESKGIISSSFSPTLTELPALRPMLTWKRRLPTPTHHIHFPGAAGVSCVTSATSKYFLFFKTCSNTLHHRLKKTFAISSCPRLPSDALSLGSSRGLYYFFFFKELIHTLPSSHKPSEHPSANQPKEVKPRLGRAPGQLKVHLRFLLRHCELASGSPISPSPQQMWHLFP